MTRAAQGLSNLWRNRNGIAAIASTYIFFLIFAQYGFLRLVEQRLGTGMLVLRPVMAVMGITGFLASLSIPVLLGSTKRDPARRANSQQTSSSVLSTVWSPRAVLGFAFLACTFTSLTSLVARTDTEFYIVAGLIGLSLGVLTVTLATHLRSLVPAPGYGLAIGAGTGLAYWICNLPPVFEGEPELQAVVAGLATLVGFVVISTSTPSFSRTGTEVFYSATNEPSRLALGPEDCRGIGVLSIVLTFLALVWLDSAAFNIIQETFELKSGTWGSPAHKWMMGAAHLLAALLGGWLIDRGFFRSIPVVAFALFVVSFTLLTQYETNVLLAGPLYAVGISIYSVALVAYPSYVADQPGLVARRWRAAGVYGIGGWLGSALGVGMAQDLHRIPSWFLVAAGALVFAAWILPRAAASTSMRELARTFGGAIVVATFAGLIVVLTGTSSGTNRPVESTDLNSTELGLAVYIAEGCINCHSQYVRPEGNDRSWWGPPSPDPGGPKQPLIGNRRQGPDLARVGNRRSTLWQELHLRNPQSTSPGSRMPSYGHLFDDSRGDALVAYLDSLGETTAEERRELIDRWGPHRAHLESASTKRGRALFRTFCARCHGEDARGDGPLVETANRTDTSSVEALLYQLERPSMNLRKDWFVLLDWDDLGSEPVRSSPAMMEPLMRLIRFGMPGTSMPGHESLDERALADLAAYVLTLPGTNQVTGSEEAGP